MRDAYFLPAYLELEKVRKQGTIPICLAVARKDRVLTYNLSISGENDFFVCERLVKTMLWILGGTQIYTDNLQFAEFLKSKYKIGGEREFDSCFMTKIFGGDFNINYVAADKIPNFKFSSSVAKLKSDGYRIGLDVGGSELKVCALDNGKAVYFNNVAWQPKTNADPLYYNRYFLEEVKRAAEYLPRIDSIGVSTAGVVVGKKLKTSSIFLGLSPQDAVIAEDIFERLQIEAGATVTVINDGDAAALLSGGDTLAISMGTSQAGGYIDGEGHINGNFIELAFVPIDFYSGGALDEWSGDRGCGVKYFSTDAVIRLAEQSGFDLKGTPPQKIKKLLSVASKEQLNNIYDIIGEYLGYSLPYYGEFLSFSKVLLTGGVTGGEWGERIVAAAQETLKKLNKNYVIELPKTDRRLGQAFAAAQLCGE